MREPARRAIRLIRQLLAISLVGLLLALAMRVLIGQSALAERLATAAYETFLLLALAIAIELWLSRSTTESRRPKCDAST